MRRTGVPLRASAIALIGCLAFTTARVSAQANSPAGRAPDELMTLPAARSAGVLPVGWTVRAVRGMEAPRSQVVDSGGTRFLRLSGTKRAAWFVHPLDVARDADAGMLHWTWRAPIAPEGASAASAATDDAPLRVFVVFERHSRLARTPRAIFYTLSDGAPPAAAGPRGPLVAVHAGSPALAKDWVSATADPAADYRRLWGGAPPPIVAVGVMQDTDQTMRPAMGDLLQLEWRARASLRR